MAAVETGQPRAHGKTKKHKKKRRLGIRIDMTPMVDVAFLLLTFFILTSSMSRPQTMELNLPPDDKTQVEVAESNLLTLRVDKDGGIFWNIGVENPQKVEFKDLRKLLSDRNTSNPKLITLVKVDRDGTYKMMVDVMDELNLANITRFSLAPMKDADRNILKKVTS
jgi:biopolymer transport protein ExbD